MQFGITWERAKGHAEYFRAQAGAAHAEQQRMLEAGTLHVLGDQAQMFDVGQLVVRNPQPAEPIALVFTRPQVASRAHSRRTFP